MRQHSRVSEIHGIHYLKQKLVELNLLLVKIEDLDDKVIDETAVADMVDEQDAIESFYQTFAAEIESDANTSDISKFNYLMGQLEPKVANVVANLAATNDNYPVLVKTTSTEAKQKSSPSTCRHPTTYRSRMVLCIISTISTIP